MKLNKMAATVVAALSVPLCHAATGYTSETAPDALSKAVLETPILTPEEGAVDAAGVPAAIHRNFPKIIEQNFAGMPAGTAANWVHQLGDVELDHLAQRYVNANASAARKGKFLQLAALRLEGPDLGRLSKFFGYKAVHAAVAAMAPAKLADFKAYSSPSFAAPIPGAEPFVPSTVQAPAGVVTMSGFTPEVTMTLDEIYIGFRTMQVGCMATTGALYETAAYAGAELYAAWTAGYWFGGQLTTMMQTYEPDFYYGTFVNWVGVPADWLQDLVYTTYSYGTNLSGLGSYQSTTLPTMGTTTSQINSMGNLGGDWGTELGYETFEGGGGGACPRGQKCPPEWPY
jgi:hypothetical protein